jgi:hypothetical protein
MAAEGGCPTKDVAATVSWQPTQGLTCTEAGLQSRHIKGAAQRAWLRLSRRLLVACWAAMTAMRLGRERGRLGQKQIHAGTGAGTGFKEICIHEVGERGCSHELFKTSKGTACTCLLGPMLRRRPTCDLQVPACSGSTPSFMVT